MFHIDHIFLHYDNLSLIFLYLTELSPLNNIRIICRIYILSLFDHIKKLKTFIIIFITKIIFTNDY